MAGFTFRYCAVAARAKRRGPIRPALRNPSEKSDRQKELHARVLDARSDLNIAIAISILLVRA
jgi:hypothetical protein